MLEQMKRKLLLRDEVCTWWIAYGFDNPLRRIFHDPERILGRYLRPGMTVLDIGCGMGYFSIAMARMAENTRVIALDIQERMLEIMKKRASRAGVLDRISPRLAESGSLGLGEGIDFALSFWMVHEVPDRKRLLSQVHALLKDGGRYLIVEPRIHTGNDYFRELESIIEEAGFRIIDRPPVSLSRAVLLEK